MSEPWPDYYAVLGVARSASIHEIKRAYRRCVRLVHPDANPDGQAPLAGSPDISLVNEAWVVLGDPDTRSAYDLATQDRARRPAKDPDWDNPLGVALPPVPDGFESYSRSRNVAWGSSGRVFFHPGLGDAFHHGLSLAAQTADLSNLSRLGDDDLWLLDVSRLPVTDHDLRSLARFRRLEVLMLDQSAVTDAGLESLRHFPLLQTVTLTKCRITDDGVPALASIPALQNLELDETALTDDGLAGFEANPTLIVLDIRKTKVRGRGMHHLTGMPALRELRVSGWAELAARRAFRGRPEVRIL